MKWVDRYPALVLLTIETAILSFCLADGQLALAGISALIVGFAWFVRKRKPPVNLPKFAVTLLVLAAVIHAFLSRTASPSSGQAVVSHLGEFLVYIQLIKLFDRRTFRDETHVLTLSVFVVIASILTSNELLVGALLLVYAVMATACAMLAQIRQGRMQGDAEGGAGEPLPASGRAARRRGPDVQFGLLSLGATAVIGLIATVLFVFTPRGVGENTLGTFGRARQMTIGYTDTVKLGQSGLLSESPTPVLEMRVTDAEGRNVGSPGRLFYLRGATRSVYKAAVRTWDNPPSTSNLVHRLTQEEEDALTMEPYSPNSLLIQQISTRRNPAAGSPVFGVWRPVSIRFAHPAAVIPDPRDGTLRLPGRGDRPAALRYTLTSSPTYSEEFEDPGDEPRVDKDGVFAPPELDAVIAEALAARGVTLPLDVSEPFAVRTACAAIRDHLQQNYDYTLDLPAPPGNADPVIWFLTSSKSGHCEYFASAMTLMLQRIGVPARLVTGYVAGEYNNVNGDYIVRESNAHAWVEAYLGEGRWQMYDPTPAGVVESLHRPDHTLLGRLRQWYDMLEFNWSSAVVGFDKSKQSEFLSPYSEGERFFDRAGRWFSEAGERLLDRIGARRLGIDVPPALVPLFPVIVLLSIGIYIAGGAVARRVARAVRGARRRDPELSALMRQARFYQRALRVLDRVGLAKPRSRAPLTHALALERESAEAAGALRVVAEAFYRVRFGRHSLTPAELSAAERAVSEMEAALRRR